MATSVDHVLEHILEGRIDKEDALRNFEGLSDEDKQHVVVSLKEKLGRHDEGAPADQSASASAPQTLKSVHEGNVSEAQKDYIRTLSRQYADRMPTSKQNAQRHQAYFVDQRKVAGLKKILKPMQFQLTYERADGAYLYDVDGNKYVDITGDNGVNFFGHQPEFLKKALTDRMNRGNPLVAYSEDLFEAARLFCELTGHERMVFTQTGTEAVMWVIRIARAATGRKKVVIFDGSYHGLSDTVLALKGRNGSSMSAGLGLLQEFADQLIILDYGDMDQLEVIERRANEIACVLVEPVQSRFPDRQPLEFVQELRKLTLEKDIVLVFDEMITGFRAGRKGAEAFYKVKPDLATHGKVSGGGLPNGIIAGLAKYMNYVDGGVWGLDDDSMPSIKRAIMAGTHTQNSLKVAATRAVCEEMTRLCDIERECDYATCTCKIAQLNRRSEAMCEQINAYFCDKRVPLVLDCFSSQFRFRVTDDPNGLIRELLILLLRLNGIETSTSGNCFLNLAHSDDDIRAIIEGFSRSVEALLDQGFFCEAEVEAENEKTTEVETESESAANTEQTGDTAVRVSMADESGQMQIEKLKTLLLADLRSIDVGGK